MTLTATVPKKGYTSAGETVFAIPFQFADIGDIDVYVNGALITVGFVITGAGIPTGGLCTFAAATTPGDKILLVRSTTRNQGTNWSANDPDPAESKEQAFDKAMGIDQEQDEQLSRTPTYRIDNTLIVAPMIDTPDVGKFATAKDSLGNIGWAVPAAPGSLNNPVSLIQGGTGFAASTLAGLLQSLGADVLKQATINPSAGVITGNNPWDTSVVNVNNGNPLSRITTTGVVTGTLITVSWTNGGNVLTNEVGGAGQLVLLGRVNYTTVAGDRSTLLFDGGSWLEIDRQPAIAFANGTKFYRGDGQYANAMPPIGGCQLANNGGDPVNDIDISVGARWSDDAVFANRAFMSLVSALTKQSDVNWAVGNNQGMLDTGAIANNTYHMFLIMRIDTGVVDVLLSLSATAPTMPANYTKKWIIGSIIRSGGTIVAFKQANARFTLAVPIASVSAVGNPGTAAVLRAMNIPTGRILDWTGSILYGSSTGGAITNTLVTDPASTDTAPSNTLQHLRSTAAAFNSIAMRCLTNVSAQVRVRHDFSDANAIVNMITDGWYDFASQGVA